MHHATAAPQRSDALTLIAGTWLASGCVLLGLTPLPWHDATLGWTPAFWLLAAPCLLLLARIWCARQTSSSAALQGHRNRPAKSNAVPMPMASRARPRARPMMAVVTPRTTDAGLRPARPRTARPARRVG